MSRKFYIIYILIDKYRSYEDYSWITIRKVLDFYGYDTKKNKPKAVYEILDVLKYMISNQMIEVKQDISSLSYDTGIEIKIIPENFDCTNKFTKLTVSQFDTIMSAKGSLTRENILVVFLYIISYIRCRKKSKAGSDMYDDNNPESFYKSINSMSADLGMSKATINQCIDYLITPSKYHPALLVKEEVGSIQPDKSKPPINVPNIYVLNKDGYEKEIELTLKKIMRTYKVDGFFPLKHGNSEF